MKATIDANGDLSVIAENEIESYALSCWWNAYLDQPQETKRPAFRVQLLPVADVATGEMKWIGPGEPLGGS